MTIKEELIQYCHDCIADIIPSCQKHKWACQRLLKDFKNEDTEKFQYYWDEGEAEKIVKWFAYLRHCKGVLSGQPINLTTWQKFSLCQIYGWRRCDSGYKRFTHSFKEVARKNAKSQEEAGVILYEMATQSTKNGEIYECYCAGVKRKQSLIIFNECKNMLKKSPLRAKFKITNTAIQHKKTGSYLEALNKQDGKEGDGTNPAVLVLDEYHQHPTTEFYALGIGANTKESLLMIITTAGKDLTYPCYTDEYQYCTSLLNPDVDVWNDEYLTDICEMEPDDDLDKENLWVKANPIRATYKEGIEKIRSEYLIAKGSPDKMTDVLTKCFNIWVMQKDNAYMDMAKWKNCEVEEIPYDLKNRPVYVGFDLSAKIDLTSVAFIIPIQTNEITVDGKRVVKYICFSHSFVPNKDKLRERYIKDKVDYYSWERNGYLTVTNTDIVDQNAVIQYVKDYCKKNSWNIQCYCFDPNGASKLMLELSDEGYDVAEVYQSHKSLNESTKGFRDDVYCKNVLYIHNPLLNYAMSNAQIKINNGFIKIDKDATTKRIDPVDATLAAFKLAMYHDFRDTTDVDEWLDS